MPVKMNRELTVVVMPNGSLQLERMDTQEIINKSISLLQDEIYKRFTAGSKIHLPPTLRGKEP